MADGGRHRSDRAPGLSGCATVVGLVLLSVTIALAVTLAAVLLL